MKLRSFYQLIHECTTVNIPEDDSVMHRILIKCAEYQQEHLNSIQTTYDIIGICQLLKELSIRLDTAADEINQSLTTTLRQIQNIQNKIQFSLKKDIDWMKKVNSGNNEYLNHLQGLSLLPSAYENLLIELVRRKEQFSRLQSYLTPIKNTIKDYREIEIKHRETFMKEYGVHLPPFFLKLIPSLKSKPPYFDLEEPIEKQKLPEISENDLSTNRLLALLKGKSIDENENEEGGGTIVNNEIAVTTISAEQNEEEMNNNIKNNNNAQLMLQKIRQSSFRFPSMEPPAITNQLMEGNQQLHSKVNGLVEENQLLRQELERLKEELAQKTSTLESVIAATTSKTFVDTETQVETEVEVSANTIVVDDDNATTTATVLNDNSAGAESGIECKESSENVTIDVIETISHEKATKDLAEKKQQQQLIPWNPIMLLTGYEYISKCIDSVEISKDWIKDWNEESANFVDMITTAPSFLQELVPTIQLDENDSGKEEQFYDALDEQEYQKLLNNQQLIQVTIENMRKLMITLAYRNRLPVISFMDFKVDDIALFMPANINNRKIWMAYNSGCPYHFLAEESVDVFLKKSRNPESRTSIIGRIIMIQKMTSTSSNTTAGADMNESRDSLVTENQASSVVPPGEVYHICHAEPLYRKTSNSSIVGNNNNNNNNNNTKKRAVKKGK
jgi:hypothetical protein